MSPIRRTVLALGLGAAAGTLLSMLYLPLAALPLLLYLLLLVLPLASIRNPWLLVSAAACLLTCWVATRLPTRLMDQRVQFAADRVPLDMLPRVLEARGWPVRVHSAAPDRWLVLPARNPSLIELHDCLLAQRLGWLLPPGRCGYGRRYSLLLGADSEDELVLRWFSPGVTDKR